MQRGRLAWVIGKREARLDADGQRHVGTFCLERRKTPWKYCTVDSQVESSGPDIDPPDLDQRPGPSHKTPSPNTQPSLT